jgi:hypothetical protein
MIMEQKYTSFISKGLEAYFEWRRTGNPVLDPGDRTSDVTNGRNSKESILQSVRWNYP